jgi:hypothetical protein
MFDSEPIHKTNNLILRFIANHVFSPLYSFFLKLYLRWGTSYKLTIDSEVLDKLGSDYDENGIPYWENSNYEKNINVDYHGGWGLKKDWE